MLPVAEIKRNHNFLSSLPWIYGPGYDIFFFSPIWWLPVCAAAFIWVGPWVGMGLFFVLYHVVIRLPHFMATLPVTYMRKENWQYYLSNWVKYIAVPVGLLAVYFFFGDLSDHRWSSLLLLNISLIWGLQHIAFQNYGILQVYHARGGLKDSGSSLLEKAIYFFVFLGSIVPMGQADKFRLFYPTNSFDWLMISRSIQMSFLTILFAIYLLRAYRAGRKSIPGILFLVTSVAAMIYWPFYEWSGDRFLGLSFFFYMYNAQHCLSYIGLVGYMRERRRLNRNLEAKLFSVPRVLGFALILIAISAAVIYTLLLLQPGSLLQELKNNQSRLFAGLEGFYVVHYYLESISWRYKIAHNRENMFSLLAPITTSETSFAGVGSVSPSAGHTFGLQSHTPEVFPPRRAR